MRIQEIDLIHDCLFLIATILQAKKTGIQAVIC